MASLQRWFPRPYLFAILILLWLLLVNSIHPGHVVLASILSWVIAYTTRSFWPQAMQTKKPLLAGLYLARLMWDILVANWQVARMILLPSRRLQPAFITYPLTLEMDFTITLLANTISMTPGTVVVDFSHDRRSLLIHALHALDNDEAIAEIKHRYEMPLKEIFEC